MTIVSGSMEIPYVEYFGLAEKPFSLTPDPLFYFESRSHREALDHLRFFLDQREGFALIYGDVGTGKTTLSRIFLGSLDRDVYASALILNPIMDDHGLLREILTEFAIDFSGSGKKEGLDALKAFLLDRHRQGKRSLLVIDEAQLITPELFEFIRVLSNFETDKEKVLQIVLFAQPEIMKRLAEDEMRYLSQRITVIYVLKPLESGEVSRYVGFRLFTAGSKGLPRFNDDALKIIHRASEGCPRLINVLCDRCMLILYSTSGTNVTRAIARAAGKEMNIAILRGRRKKLSATVYVVLSIAAALLLMLFWWDFATLYRVVFSQP